MTQIQKPYDVTFSPNLSGLTIAGRNASATRITVTNNDSRDCSEVRINVLRADLMPSNTMFEAAIIKDGAGEKVVTEKWVQAKMSTDVAYTPIDDWSSPIAFTLDSLETKAFDIKLVIPDTITVQGKISFSLLVSFKANIEAKVTSISIDGTPLSDITKGSLPVTTLTATVIADVGADTSVTWQSSNEDVFTIDSSGVVTTVGAGKAIVTAVSSDTTKYNGVYLTILPEPVPPEGVVAWYDANDASTITESGGAVSQWDDKSGNNYHATSTGVEPVTNSATLNSKNVLLFTNGMNIPTGVIPTGNQPYTIVGVWKSPELNQTLICMGTPGYLNLSLGVHSTLTGIRHFWWTNDLESTPAILTPMRVIASYDGTTRKLNTNGNIITDVPTARNTGVVSAMIGAVAGYSYNLDNGGYIAELMVYHKKLTVTEEADLQAYILYKWGV